MKLTIAIIGKDKELEALLQSQKTADNEIITVKNEAEAVKKAKGEYIAFVYAQDSVSKRYTQAILEKTEKGFDVCYIGWQYIDWHSFRHIGYAGDFKPLFSTVYRNEFIKEKEQISDTGAKRIDNLCEIIYDFRSDKN